MKTRFDGQVLCYMYQRCYEDGPFYQVDECFIPSEKICFSRDKVSKSEIPNNKDDGFFESHTILKKMLLPIEWIDNLKEKLDKNIAELDREETQNIFGESLFIDFFASERDFEKNYEQFGTFILPNYIMRYFDEEKNMHADSKTANRILNIISSLDDTEKKSLAICLDERIKYLIKKRQAYSQDKKIEFPMSLSTGTAAVITGVATGLIFKNVPVGIFAGGLALFGKKKNDDFLKKQCKEYCNKIFDLLSVKSRQYFPS